MDLQLFYTWQLRLFIVESENMFTLRGRTPHYTFVGAG